MPVKFPILLLLSLLCSCASYIAPVAQSQQVVSTPWSDDIHLEVVGMAGGYTNSAMTEMIRSGIRRSGVTCVDLSLDHAGAECRVIWSMDRADPIRPITTYFLSLYVDGSLIQTALNHVPNPDTQPTNANIRQISETILKLRKRVLRQNTVATAYLD